MVRFLYDILLLLLSPAIIAFHVYRTLSRGRSLAGFGERFGFIPREKLARLAGEETVWVHAVSVGETLAVRPLLRELRRRWPQKRIVLSNVTETGRRIAEGMAEVDFCVYFPFDFPFAARRALRSVSPSLVLVVETEIWPNFLRAARGLGIPAVMVNGRISDRSFPRYLKLRRFFAPILTDFAALCMQSEEDARRIAAIGAPVERVHGARNLKYDLPARRVSAKEKAGLRHSFRLPEVSLVVTAGSTHPGEEGMVLDAFTPLASADPALLLVLVPRHPERAGEVARLLAERGMPFVLRSELDKEGRPPIAGGCLLVDTIGELMKLYTLSDLAFVGGSLVPVGGHNLLEPASVGVPVLFGPHMHNFREITSLVLSAEAGRQVADGSQLREELNRLLDDGALRVQMGENGLRLMEQCGGGAALHMDLIESLLAARRSR